MVVDRVVGFERALREQVLEPLGLSETEVALSPVEVHGHSYDPRWVGHRTLVAPARDVARFWLAVARSELVPVELLTESVPIGQPAPGFARPSYGLGVMHDPASPLGELIGHGGGGPGFSTAAFAVLGDEPVVAVVLSDEDIDAQDRALSLLGSGVRDRR